MMRDTCASMQKNPAELKAGFFNIVQSYSDRDRIDFKSSDDRPVVTTEPARFVLFRTT